MVTIPSRHVWYHLGMKIEMDAQGRITPSGAIKKRDFIDVRGKVTRAQVDVCSECGAEVEVRRIVGVLHECSPNRVKTHYD